MRKLLVALILALILSLTFATPAFADDGKGNMPGKAGDLGNFRGLWNAFRCIGMGFWINGFYPPSQPCVGAWLRHWDIRDGQPPAKPHWAGGP